MNKKKYSLAGIALLLAVCSWSWPTVSAQAGTEEIGLSIEPEFSFDSGDYGGGDTITTTSFSITGEYDLSDAWTLSLTIVPWLHQDETYTDVVLVAGRPVHHTDSTGLNPHHESSHIHGRHDHHKLQASGLNASEVHNHSYSGPDRNNHGLSDGEVDHDKKVTRLPAYSPGQPSKTTTEVTTAVEEQEVIRHGSATGIGDTTIDLSYRLMEEHGAVPEVSLHGGLKIPTADEDKGLGTGKVDYLLGVDVSRGIGPWTLEAGVTYNILGEPDEYELDNYLSGYGEISNALAENLELAVQLSGAQAASDESEGELALGMQLRYDMEEIGEFSAGVEKGLADGSPDYSVVIGYSISF